MPKEAAERLLAAWNKDPNCLAKLKVVDVKIHPEIIQEKNVDKV